MKIAYNAELLKCVNSALYKIGKTHLNSFTDQNNIELASMCKEVSEEALIHLTSLNAWRRLRKDTSLFPLSNKSIKGKNVFKYPEDFSSIVSLYTDTQDAEFLSDYIISSAKVLEITYTYIPTDITTLAPELKILLSTIYAQLLAPTVVGDSTAITIAANWFNSVYRKCKAINLSLEETKETYIPYEDYR